MWYYSRIMGGPIKFGTATAALVLLLATAIAGPGAAFAADDTAKVIRKYPPYPDVWGRELPFPDDGRYDDRAFAAGRASFFMSVYEGPEGRILFSISSGSATRPRIHGHHVFDFFGNRFRTLLETSDFEVSQNFRWPPPGAANRYPKVKNLQGEWGVLSWDMPGGTRLSYILISRFSCRHEWDYKHFAIRRPKGKVGFDTVAEKILIKLFSKPVERRVPARCRTGRDKDDYYTAKWRQLGGVFTPLADGTLLFSNDSSPTIIRFRRDFTSPYIEANTNLFMMDLAAYLKALDRAAKRPGSLSQNVDDAVYDVLMKLKKQRKEKFDAR